MTPQPAPFRSFGRRATLKEMHITPMNPKANPPTVSASQSHSRLLAHLMALMVSAIWATTFVCSKELLAYYSPAQVMFMRFAIAYFVLWLLRPRPLPWQGRGELTFLLLRHALFLYRKHRPEAHLCRQCQHHCGDGAHPYLHPGALFYQG